jgi:hypothetical protein
MATFMIPGDVITNVRALGSSAPDTGFYEAKIVSIERHASRPTSRRVNLSFNNGFTCIDWMNVPYTTDGQILSGYSEEVNGALVLNGKGRGMVAAAKAVFCSAGYTDEQMKEAGGVSDDWLTGRTVYVEWHDKRDLDAAYGRVVRFLDEATFNRLKGTVPAIAQKAEIGASVNAPTGALAATVAPAPAGAPNGAGAVLPPPPNARTITA